MPLATRIDQPASGPAPWLRVLADWGLGLNGSSALMPVAERQCPLRPLLSRLGGKTTTDKGTKDAGC